MRATISRNALNPPAMAHIFANILPPPKSLPNPPFIPVFIKDRSIGKRRGIIILL
jgi:hypothetical protein